jgi:hypothetical protein
MDFNKMKSALLGRIGLLAFLLAVLPAPGADPPRELVTGIALHAFDHWGGMTNLAGPAAACGATILYCNGVGARAPGIQLAIGSVGATAIVNLDSFDKNWTPQFRARFHSPPSQWRQLDKNGQVLSLTCMNNPDWRTYEKFMVRSQLKGGCDGIFFDNPTVHPDGCYCPFCMEKFDAFLAAKPDAARPEQHSFESLRQWAIGHPAEFLEFRSTIAADFLADMRAGARAIKPRALITCNNGLNSPDALFSQCRATGCNINALSQAEDYVLVEDMGSQARQAADGRIFEYGPTYKQLHAISHGKPIVACTLADADYQTSPDLARLSMAEAAANDASWLLCPAWPENMRQAAAAAILPEAQFLRRNEMLLNNMDPCCDVVLFLCFRRWLETDHCAASAMAAALGRANIQFAVCSEDNLAEGIASGTPLAPVLLLESLSILNEGEKQAVENFRLSGGQVVAADEEKDWLGSLHRAVAKPSLVLRGPATLRAVVRYQLRRVVVHLYNLDVQRLSPFQDQVHPARQIGITLRVPFERVRSVHALTADAAATRGALDFTAQPDGTGTILEMTYPQLEISTILLIEPLR